MQTKRFPDFLQSESEDRTGRNRGDALFQIIPVPLEQTVSYGAGTARGPGAILLASQQLERWDGLSEPLVAGIATGPFIDCSGRKVVGFDLVELAPRSGDHGSDFATAQLVYSVMGLITRNLGIL